MSAKTKGRLGVTSWSSEELLAKAKSKQSRKSWVSSENLLAPEVKSMSELKNKRRSWASTDRVSEKPPLRAERLNKSKSLGAEQLMLTIKNAPGLGHSATLPIIRTPSTEKSRPRPQTVPVRGKQTASLSLTSARASIDWSLRWSIDKFGKGDLGELRKPSQVDFLKNGDVVVFEAKKYRIQVLNRHGDKRLTIDRRTDKHLTHPKSMCTAMDGQIVVVADNSKVVLYDCNGKYLQSRTMTQNKIYNLASRGPHFVMAETGQTRSVVERSLDGGLIRRYEADYRAPRQIAVQPDNQYVGVTDSENHCVFLFDERQRKYIRKIGCTKYCERKVIWPTGVAFSSADSILIADKAQDFIAEYDLRGYYKCDVLTGERDGLQCPLAIAINRKGKIAVTEELLDYKRDHYNLKMFSPVSASRSSISC